MTIQSTSNPRAETARLEEELFGRLGLTRSASSQDIETAHDELVRFLHGAPQDLRVWAQRQVVAADEAYALLSDPSTDLAALASARSIPLDPEPDEIGAAGPRANELAGSPTAGTRRRSGRVTPLRRVLLAAGGVVAAVAIVFAVYSAGATSAVPGIDGTPAPESSTATLDTARVGELMSKLQANPQDVATLSQLGDLYFQAQDYKTAGDWMTKILAVDPKNISALLGLGAAQFNQGDSAGAEKQWRAVIAIEPQNQEAYYDLGFMYLSENPPDMANVAAMWNRVIEIDPTTDVAKTVKTHLDSFAAASPDASGAASPAASAGSSTAPSAPASPEAAPAASPSASGN